MKVFLQVILLDAVRYHLVSDILSVHIVLSTHWQQRRAFFKLDRKGQKVSISLALSRTTAFYNISSRWTARKCQA